MPPMERAVLRMGKTLICLDNRGIVGYNTIHVGKTSVY